jgi:hypothetical protein
MTSIWYFSQNVDGKGGKCTIGATKYKNSSGEVRKVQKSTMAIGPISIYSSMLLEKRRDLAESEAKYREGINEGLSVADILFQETAERFVRCPEDDAEIWRIGCVAVFSQLIKNEKKSPRSRSNRTRGRNEGLEIAMQLFEEFAREHL